MFRTLVIVSGFLALGAVVRADDTKQGADAAIGTWRQVAVIVDGKDMPVGPATLLTTTKEGWAVTVDGKPYRKGTAKADESKSPVQSDVTFADGELAGQTLRQISKIEGDVLLACIGPRPPTEFKSHAGSGQTLSVWIRVK